ncbi:MAG TPA: nucleotidyltransferase family protein [Candidatus Angelobacter sp.]
MLSANCCKKAFLLAAGSGIRLRPLTDNVPKCLLPIQGVPLLQIWLELCDAAGIRDVLINVHAHAQKVREFAARQDSRVRLTIVEEEELLGSAGTLVENREFVADQEAFFVLYADVLTNMDLREMLAFHRRKNTQATLGVYQVPDPNRCGVVSINCDDIIESFVEKPAHPESNWAFSGVMVAHPKVLELIPANRPADIGFHLLPQLVGKMTAYRITDYLLDIGTPENYAAAQTSWPGLVE